MSSAEPRRAGGVWGTPLVAGAVVAGLALRLGMLGQGLWRDEASTYFDAVGGTLASVLARTAYSELNPPGYFLFMHGWFAAVPVTDFFMQLPSVLASLATVPIAAAIGKRLAGGKTAILCAWIFALAPMNLYYAQEARPYMFTAACTMLALLGLLTVLDEPRRTRGYGYLAAGAAGAVTTQYTGVVAIGCFFIVWAYARMRRLSTGVIAPIFAIGMLLLVLGYAMWPALATQLHAGLSWNAPLTLASLPHAAALDFTVTLPLDWFPKHQLAKALLIALIALEALVVLARRTAFRFPGGRYGAFVAVALAGIALAEVPISNEGRYMVPFSGLMWLLLAAWLLHGFTDSAARRRVGLYAATAFCAALLVFDVATIRAGRGQVKAGIARLAPERASPGLTAPDWRSPGTIVVATPDYLAATVGYYLRDDRRDFNGFARWEKPQIFSPLGYAALWRDPDAVATGLRRVGQAREAGATRLILISQRMNDSGGLPYARGNRFVEALRAGYPLIAHTALAARIEPIDVDVLDLRSSLNKTTTR